MEEKDILAIQQLVNEYCEREGLVPQGCQMTVTLSIQPVPLVKVKTAKYMVSDVPQEVLESEIMDCDASKLLADYLESLNYHRSSASKVVNSLSRILGKREPTVRDVVYFNDVDDYWLKYRNLGKKGLKHIDNWLATLNLKRLPKPH
jgi:hypothetical protein